MVIKKIIKTHLLGILCCLLGSVFAKTYQLTPSDNIKSFIEQGQPGDVFKLGAGSYINPGSIHIPSNTSIEGDDKAMIFQTMVSETSTTPVFDVSNTSGITIKNLIINIGSHTSGITNSPNDYTNNLLLEHVNIIGNRNQDLSGAEGYSSAAVFIHQADNVNIENSTLKNTFGGVYLIGDNVKILNNSFSLVSLTNIYV